MPRNLLRLRSIKILFVLLGLTSSSKVLANDAEITRYASQLAVMLEDNDADLSPANIQVREMCLDMNGYKPCYEFAMFTLVGTGGGNGTWATYLVLFQSVDPPFNPNHLKDVGNGNNKKYQFLDMKKISDDKIGNEFLLKDAEVQHSFIILHGKGHKESDPECCPSKSVTLGFAIDDDKIDRFEPTK